MKIEAPETRRLRHFLPDQEQRVRVEYDVHFLVAHLRRELRILDEFYRPSRMSKRGHQKAHPSSVLPSRRCHNTDDPNAALPSDWSAFLAYCRAMEASGQLGVSRRARAMAHELLRGAGSWIKPPHWYCALTTEWLATRFRQEFGLPFGDTEKQAAERAKQRLPRFYPRLPGAIRFIGPWHEAQARLKGKGIGVVGRLANRFWIGESRLPFFNEDSGT